MFDTIRIDDVLAAEVEPIKPVVHTIRLTPEQKQLIENVREIYGEKKTAELLRRGIEAVMNEVLARSKANY